VIDGAFFLEPDCDLDVIERASDSESALCQHVGIGHRSTDIAMAQQFLDGADIVSLFEEVSGEGVSERVAACVLVAAGAVDGDFDCALKNRRVDVVSEDFAGVDVDAVSGCGEDELPAPFRRGIRVLGGECKGEGDAGISLEHIAFIELVDSFEVEFEGGNEGSGEHSDAILVSFAGLDGDSMEVEVDVFDTEVYAFVEAEASAVEEVGHEEVIAGEVGEDFLDFRAGEDDGEFTGAVCPGELSKRADIFVEDFFIEEDDSIEGLVLGRGGGM
jgi:hypothetical protein